MTNSIGDNKIDDKKTDDKKEKTDDKKEKNEDKKEKNGDVKHNKHDSKTGKDNKKDQIAFSNQEEYIALLDGMKAELNKNYNDVKSSTNLKLKDIKILKVIGTGGFGTVKLCKSKLAKESFCALKIELKQMIVKYKKLKQMLMEKRIGLSLNFPFLTGLYNTYKDYDCVYLLMPFINGGDMWTLLRNQRKFSDAQAKFYIAQVVMALEYLQHADLVYRDLKPENVLMDYRGYTKIADFGFCKRLDGRTYTFCGTPDYVAPEVILMKGYGKSADWWTVGVLVFEMLSGRTPFYSSDGDAEMMKLYGDICDGKYRIPNYFSKLANNFVKSLLQTDPSKRLGNMAGGVSQIKDHEWLKDTKWDALFNRQIEAPWVPKLSGPGDATHFDECPDMDYHKSSKCLFEREFEEF